MALQTLQFWLKLLGVLYNFAHQYTSKIKSTQVGFEPETFRLESWSTTTEPCSRKRS